MLVEIRNAQPPSDLTEMSAAEAAPLVAEGARAYEALVRFRQSAYHTPALDKDGASVGTPASFFNRGEIVGVTEGEAAHYVEMGLAERVTLADRNAAVVKAREDAASRSRPETLVFLRALVSATVDDQYYSAARREIAAFPEERAADLLKWSTRDGEPFFEVVSPDEIELLLAEQERSRKQRTQREVLTLVEFEMPFACFGTRYNKGERAGFAGDRLTEVEAARDSHGNPFAKKLYDVYADDGQRV
jgi:hypothetical protein